MSLTVNEGLWVVVVENDAGASAYVAENEDYAWRIEVELVKGLWKSHPLPDEPHFPDVDPNHHDALTAVQRFLAYHDDWLWIGIDTACELPDDPDRCSNCGMLWIEHVKEGGCRGGRQALEGKWYFQMESHEYGSETFGPYDSAEEAEAGMERVEVEAVRLNDGIEREFRLILPVDDEED